MNGLLPVCDPARSARKAAVQWITGIPADLAAWSTEEALATTSRRGHLHQIRKFR